MAGIKTSCGDPRRTPTKPVTMRSLAALLLVLACASAAPRPRAQAPVIYTYGTPLAYVPGAAAYSPALASPGLYADYVPYSYNYAYTYPYVYV